jgi:hypothetical protein
MSETERDKKLEALKDATGRLQVAEAAKKRDATLHRESIAAIKGEINDIMAQLEGR